MQKIDEALRRTARSRTPTACLQCQKRKQKCSREQPCRHCSRRYPPVECIYTFEGRNRTVPLPSPNRLYVPDETPPSFYTEPKTSISRLSSTPTPQGFSNTTQNYVYQPGLEQNSPQGNVSYITTFPPASSESFRSKSPHQTASSSTLCPHGTTSYSEPEMDSNELDFQSVPQVPTNTPNAIPNYDYMGAPNLKSDGWNQNTNPEFNSGMANFPTFDESYFVPIPMQTESSQSFNISGSAAFQPMTENNGMTDFRDAPDISYSPGTPDNQNRGYGVTNGYCGSFY